MVEAPQGGDPPAPPRPDVWAVVVAGGSGSRYGAMKQFADLAGTTVAARSVAACRAAASSVVLVVPQGHLDQRCGADVVVAGGRSRSESVRRGIAAVPGEARIIIVHDAARPLATAGLFEAVLAALLDGSVAGATCAVPVADTLKRVDHERGSILETVDRAGLVAVQTPQAFRSEVLRRAHDGGADATDDAALVEALGATVRVVAGDPRNLKLTTPADLAYAAYLLERRA